MIQIVYAFAPTKTVDGKNENAFGLGDGLPWKHISQDMKNFANRTRDTILICGAKTFMSFPEPLPGRKTIVVQDMSRALATAKNGFFADAYVSELEFMEFLGGEHLAGHTSYNSTITFNRSEKYSVIGGAGIIQKAYPYADKVIQTIIRKSHRVNSDVTLPIAFVVAPTYENSGFKVIENHWYHIDEVTNISEVVYERKL
ncbi:putative dihydrofolate reductase [Klebsiella phage KMI12]|nr:putative dihydrofolate reductase [Klebsiella phage KMI12]